MSFDELPIGLPDVLFDMLLFVVKLSFVLSVGLYIVLLNVLSGMPFEVLLFFEPSVSSLVVSSRRPLRACRSTSTLVAFVPDRNGV